MRWFKDGKEPRVLEDDEKNKSRVGFLAQDVGKVLNELGFESNNDIVDIDEETTQQHIAYSKLVAPLVKSVQELSSENEKLQNKINDLEIFIMDKLGDE